MLELILAKTWPLLAGAIAVVVAWVAGKRSGKNESTVEQLKHKIETLETVQGIDEKIDQLSDDAVRDRAINRMRSNQKR